MWQCRRGQLPWPFLSLSQLDLTMCAEKPGLVFWNENMQIMTWIWTATPRGRQVAPSASVLPLWGSEAHRVMLIEGTVSVYPHQGHRVTRFTVYEPQKVCVCGHVGVQGRWAASSAMNSPVQGWTGDRQQGSTRLLLTRWLGQRSWTLPRLNIKWSF